MASGVKVDPECVDAFNTFKLGKKEAFLIFGFNENASKIVVLERETKKTPEDSSTRAKNAQWETLISKMPNDDVRYAVADVHYNLPEGPRTDMVFIMWGPETASIKRRMLLASSKDALKNTLVGVRVGIQACSYPELDLAELVNDKFKGTLD